MYSFTFRHIYAHTHMCAHQRQISIEMNENQCNENKDLVFMILTVLSNNDTFKRSSDNSFYLFFAVSDASFICYFISCDS